MQRKRVVAAMRSGAVLETDMEAVFFPCTMEQRDQPMVEEVEEIAQRVIMLPSPLDHQLSIMAWQNTQRSGQAHERRCHPRWSAVLPWLLQVLDCARRKTQRHMGAESHGLVVRARPASNRLAFRIDRFQQP